MFNVYEQHTTTTNNSFSSFSYNTNHSSLHFNFSHFSNIETCTLYTLLNNFTLGYYFSLADAVKVAVLMFSLLPSMSMLWSLWPIT